MQISSMYRANEIVKNHIVIESVAFDLLYIILNWFHN